MAYTDVESALSSVIQKLANYSSTNVFVDDYQQALSSGNAARAVILTRGPSESRKLTMGNPHNVENIWTVMVEVFTSAKSRPSQASQVVAEAEAIVAEVRKWPNLDNTSNVVTVDIDIFDEPEMGDFGGGRARSKWWRQVVEVLVVEIVAITRSE